jgi:hypothetical protein
MKKFAPWLLLFAMFSFTAFAQQNDALPANYLAGTHVEHSNPKGGGFHSNGNIPTPQGFPQGIDTLVNFTGHFDAQGVYADGSAHHIWEYSMVGNPPEKGGTTVVNAPVVPVSLQLLNADGKTTRFVKVVKGDLTHPVTCGINGVPLNSSCKPLVSDVTPFIQPFLNGPVFGVSNYSSSPVPTQFVDAVQRAEFGNQALADWHTLLAPSQKSTQVMKLTQGDYQFALNPDGSCCRFVLVKESVFNSKLFPPAAPDNSTVIGAAEVAGDITTKDISTFLFPNTYLVDSAGGCCVLGFHTFDVEAGDAKNGNQTKFYVVNYSSWISPGLFGGGFQDVTAHSHEVSETFNDPFVAFDGVHNVTPFWLNPAGQCQDVMEDGDVIEDLANPTYPVTINGFTYHPQTEALLPWFAFEKNSSAIDNAYSYPNEDALTQLSAPQPLNCGQ